jgi:hypothetical protein
MSAFDRTESAIYENKITKNSNSKSKTYPLYKLYSSAQTILA